MACIKEANGTVDNGIPSIKHTDDGGSALTEQRIHFFGWPSFFVVATVGSFFAVRLFSFAGHKHTLVQVFGWPSFFVVASGVFFCSPFIFVRGTQTHTNRL